MKKALEKIGWLARIVVRQFAFYWRVVVTDKSLLARLLRIAFVIVGLDAAVYVVLMVRWPWPLPVQANGQIDQATFLLQELGLGAVVTAFGTLVLGAFLGSFAIYEFSQSQEKPDLGVSIVSGLPFEPLDQQRLDLVSTDDFEQFAIHVNNYGSVLALWYMVDVWGDMLPGSSALPTITSGQGDIRYRLGNGSIQIDEIDTPHIVARSKPESWLLRLESTGSVPLYPGIPFEVGAFCFPVSRLSPPGYQISYRIVTDRTPVRTGHLTVTARAWEDGRDPPLMKTTILS